MEIKSVLILAAGKGTRLRPLTNTSPKCLLPLGDTNILHRLITQTQKYLSGAQIYINTSYLAEKIIDSLLILPFHNRPKIIWEPSALGPALTVKNHCERVEGNVLILHGDLYFSNETFKNFTRSINQREKNESILLCHQRFKNLARSIIEVKGNIIESIFEKDCVSELNDDDQLVWSYSGVIVIRENALFNFSPRVGEGISPNLINHLSSKENLQFEKCVGTRISIDNKKAYLSALEVSRQDDELFNQTL